MVFFGAALKRSTSSKVPKIMKNMKFQHLSTIQEVGRVLF